LFSDKNAFKALYIRLEEGLFLEKGRN